MSVPTISSVTPSTGHAGGRALVTIVGTNFRLPSDPPALGIVEPALSTVRVSFGGQPSLSVDVFSATEITCTTPKHDLGLVDVLLENLDDDGEPISGEAVTKVGAFTYALPSLTIEGTITRIVRQILRDMKNQIIPNVVTPVHTDYDSETGDEANLVDIASLPSIVLMGPDITPSASWRDNSQVAVASDDAAHIFEPAEVTDLQFTYVAATDKTILLLNLLNVVRIFLRRYNVVEILRDPTDESLGTVKFQVTVPLGGEPRMSTQANNSNIRSFSGSFLIRGVPFDTLQGFTNDGVVEQTYEIDEVLVDTQEIEE